MIHTLITGVIAVVGLHAASSLRIISGVIDERTLPNCLHKASASLAASHLLSPLTVVTQRRE